VNQELFHVYKYRQDPMLRISYLGQDHQRNKHMTIWQDDALHHHTTVIGRKLV